MLNRIVTGMGVPRRHRDEIIIFVTSLRLLRKTGVPFVISDRHAYLRAAHHSTDLSVLDTLPWDAITRHDFRKNYEDLEPFERYQAEALVRRHLPANLLLRSAFSPLRPNRA